MSLADFKDLGIALVTLFVLWQVVKGRNNDENQQNRILDRTLGLFSSLSKSLDQHTEALAALIRKASDTETLAIAHAEALNAQNRLVAHVTERVQALPIDISLMLTEHQHGIIRQFEPVVKALGAISVGVDAQNKALLELRQREMERRQAETVILTTQQELNAALVRAEKSLQDIFNAVLETMRDDGRTRDTGNHPKPADFGSWASGGGVAPSEHSSQQSEGDAGGAESARGKDADEAGRFTAEAGGDVERPASNDASEPASTGQPASDAERKPASD